MKRAGRVVAVVMTAVVWLVAAAPGSAGAAAPWIPGPAQELSASGGPPAFAVAPGGDVVLTWTSGDLGGGGGALPRALVQRTPADDRPAAPVVDLTPSGDLGSLTGAVARGAGEEALVLHLTLGMTGGAPAAVLKVATIGADGRLGAVRPFADGFPGVPIAGYAFTGDGAGGALGTFALTDGAGESTLYARRLLADGTTGPLASLGPIGSIGLTNQPQVALLPDGSGRVLWLDDEDQVIGARFAPGGALLGAPQRLSTANVRVFAATLAASAGGAVAAWNEPVDVIGGPTKVLLAKLPSTGAVADAAQTVVPSASVPLPGSTVALADDGTATVAWGDVTSDDPASAAGLIRYRRIAPDGALGPIAALSEPAPALHADLLPRLVPTGGGNVRAFWLRAAFTGGPALGAPALSRSLAADGTLGAQSEITTDAAPFGGQMPAATDAAGSVTVGWISRTAAGGYRFATATLDETPPAVAVTVTPTATVGEAASFSATASDNAGIASLRWEFGDGSGADGGAATHGYGRPGAYEASVTVVDRAGNVTVVRRTVTVVAPSGGAGGGGAGGGGAGGGGERPPVAARAAAALKLGKVTRRGARVTVAGTISRRANGRVTIAWSQKAGRRTIRRTVRATIARGRFSASLRLPRALVSARTPATLTVSYAGNATVRSAKATKRFAPRRAAKR